MKITELERREISRYIEHFDFSEELRNKTILITGSKGIVGTGITKWVLLANELKGLNAKVIGSTRNPDALPSYVEDGDNVQYIEFGREEEAVKDIRVDYLIHAASSTDNSFHKAYPVESFRVNYDGTERMLEIARINPGCRFLYISSEEIYGLPSDDSPAMTEDMVGAIDSLSLRSCYPLSKKASEYLCYAASQEYGIEATIIRPTVIHGLFQKYNDPRVVNEILRCVIEGKNLVMKSDGMTKKCLFYSLDAVSAVFTVLFKGEKGNAYNASNPDLFITVRDLANHVFETFAPNLHIEFENTDTAVAAGYLPHRTLVQDISKLQTLGWTPITGLDHIYEVDISRFSK
jgi:Nucleoside-diphosphate-sugar epimerases